MLKIRSLTLLILSLLVSFATFCNEPKFKYTTLYDLDGPVKEVKIKSKNPIVITNAKVKFMKNGARKNSLMSYNNEGYPVGYQFVPYSWIETVTIEYNDSNRPSKITQTEYSRDSRNVTEITFEYDGKRISEMTVTTPEVKRICRYNGEVRDNYGNWTSRNVEMEIISLKESQPYRPITFVETRDIKYYDLN
ncbi:MAG: hypothetical protein K2N03_00895 [Muribaculaceae bacterium]|nr:hypothetical protein [Muribaculaceae bacterium]